MTIVNLTLFGMLCQGVFLLKQEFIDDRDIVEAEKLLACIATRMHTLNGTSGANYNVHQLLYLSKLVEIVGSLWETSTFAFEGEMGNFFTM